MDVTLRAEGTKHDQHEVPPSGNILFVIFFRTTQGHEPGRRMHFCSKVNSRVVSRAMVEPTL
jgi:hypothetical protein